ncbi:MFS transporter [Paraflavitalea sp. CAU 1676]|uniref:MFS transporter n=1 Tax=Paraflavitalea sp. CAU 1676 TaxID=3032598 RepID=UPI0023DBC145|nr:MFS transporter [Paraflavitalea sp. CAU 1676]MDF2189212.1 MFS transporter [Paraflavitalea sp. CAU 1676]
MKQDAMGKASHPPSYILPLIVLSQFAGTSLWFAGNAILADLPALATRPEAVGHMTAAVHIGFIAGTLLFALLTIADRFYAPRVFFFSCVLGATANAATLFTADSYSLLLLGRFLTGFLLAGIYPVGMKIAADWFDKGLGKALGLLVGALVFGTAFPHLLKGVSWKLSWQAVIIATSAFAVVGGLLILLFVHEGPFKKKASGFHPAILGQVFRSPDFRAASFGYFGHMWELYTLWAFVPLMLKANSTAHGTTLNLSLWSFYIIAAGGCSCMLGGLLSQKIGSARVAITALLTSAVCASTSYFFIHLPPVIFLPFMLIWGLAVTADSPQFSTLTALTAPPAYKGTAVTAVISLGFMVSIISIQAMNYLLELAPHAITYLALAPGPILGLLACRRLLNKPMV